MSKAIQIFVLLISSIYLFPAMAQDKNAPVFDIIVKYDEVKKALVSGDAAAASKHAAEFSSTVNALDTKLLNAAELSAFKELRNKLLADAGSIASSKDLAKQRNSFESFSNNMIVLAKAARLSKPVYVDYCPMKKASWISFEKTIMNPYFGSSMLSCGSVVETIQ